jgi:phosphoribosylformimino-5-aminoimidazole carboxamide ribotide isomerase
MRFRPCIDLRNGKVVQIVGGTLDDVHQENVKVNFESEKTSAEFAELYRDKKLAGGHVIALGPNNEDAARSALKAWPQHLQIGGGITPENAATWIEYGASHVIVTSCVFKDGQLNEDNLKKLVQNVGKEKIVLDLSCRKRDGAYFIVTDRWQKFTQLEVEPKVLGYLAQYCDEFLVHGADVEGLRNGMEENLITMLGKHCPIPITYAGVAQSLEDLTRVENLGSGRVDLTIGSALDIFGGNVLFNDVVAWHKERNN